MFENKIKQEQMTVEKGFPKQYDYVTIVAWGTKEIVVVEVWDYVVNLDPERPTGHIDLFMSRVMEEVKKAQEYNYFEYNKESKTWNWNLFIDYVASAPKVTLREVVSDIIKKYELDAKIVNSKDYQVEIHHHLKPEGRGSDE